jgi:predicted dehydrogenase
MNKRNKMYSSRREFLRRTAASAVITAFPLVVPRSVLGAPGQPGPNDRIQVGIVGLGGRARWILKNEAMPGAEVVAISDCFLERMDQAATQMPGGDKWAKYPSHRQLLDKAKLDVVFVETTTHARVLVCMHALQAGCDVYAEKPLTLTIAEGRPLVKAVRHHKRVLTTGSQQRSMPINAYASKLVRDGAIGKVHTVIACNYEGPKTFVQRDAPDPVPKGLDWDLWCNQTPLHPYDKERQFKWSQWEDYDGGGQVWGVSGWGTHGLDQVQCALGTDDTGPVEIWPEEQGPRCRVTMRYANGVLLKMEGKNRGHEDLGAIFVGDKGRIEIVRGNFHTDLPELKKAAPPITPEGSKESVPHIQNFFDCVRSRKLPAADVEIGHRATTLCHLMNICRKLQRKLKWDPQAELFVGDEEANKLISRPRRAGYELPKIG